ncbi:MAG: sulfatase-like hydrolase/transferase, partial [Magnetovibrio sp.]|nr:sulfatase-like hydrolase/transferase [Magnetovibrio sp.]
ILIWLLILFIPKARPHLKIWAASGTLIALTLGFLGALAWSVIDQIHLGLLMSSVVPIEYVHRLKVWGVMIAPVLAAPFVVVVFRLTVRALRNNTPLVACIDTLATAVAGMALLGVSAAYLLLPTPAQSQGGVQRNLVLLVIDHFPAWPLATYNPAAKVSELDKVLKTRAAVFSNMRVPFPYTHGYFGTLYRGGLEGEQKRGNLLDRLQRNGVDTRLMVSHRNALPEASNARIESYAGLKSRLIGPTSAIIPRFLGLKYHLSLRPPGRYEGRLLPVMWSFLNPSPGNSDVLDQIVLPQLEEMASQSAKSFISIHVPLEQFATSTNIKTTPQFMSPSYTGNVAAIHGNDYRYPETPENKVLAKHYRDTVRAQVAGISRPLVRFLDKLDKDPLLQNTMVIVTADHGAIFDKGRFWYGYHPVDEVIKVPTFIFGRDKPSVDERLFTTMDITKTILEYFDTNQPSLNSNSRSLFGPQGHEQVASLTQRSDLHNEWFLVIFDEDKVYRFNIHPDGNAKMDAFELNGFSETIRDMQPEEMRTARTRARDWLNRYGINFKKINAP